MSRPGLRLVLASGSPRRRELLRTIGIDPEVRPAEIDERRLDDESTVAYVERLARQKAEAVARPGELVLAADTIVEVDGDVLGKPADDGDARAMLTRLSGRSHLVRTGVAVVRSGSGAVVVDHEDTEVRFDPLSARDIDRYVASGEPRDKAGAYGVQGLAALFIPEIRGSWSNVVGLPLSTVHRLLRRLGVELF